MACVICELLPRSFLFDPHIFIICCMSSFSGSTFLIATTLSSPVQHTLPRTITARLFFASNITFFPVEITGGHLFASSVASFAMDVVTLDTDPPAMMFFFAALTNRLPSMHDVLWRFASFYFHGAFVENMKMVSLKNHIPPLKQLVLKDFTSSHLQLF